MKPMQKTNGGKVDMTSKGRIKQTVKLQGDEKQKLSTNDLFGSGAKYATTEEMRKMLDELRAQDK